MSLTFATAVAEALHDDFDATKYTTFMGRWINDAYAQMIRKARIRGAETTSTISTVNGTRTITIPTDLAILRGIFHADNAQSQSAFFGWGTDRQLLEVDFWDIESMNSTTGKPAFFALEGANLVLAPTPNAVYPLTVHYEKLPATLSGTDAITLIPGDKHDALVAYARSKAFAMEDDPEMSAFWQNEWIRMLTDLTAELQSETRTRHRQVPGLTIFGY